MSRGRELHHNLRDELDYIITAIERAMEMAFDDGIADSLDRLLAAAYEVLDVIEKLS